VLGRTVAERTTENLLNAGVEVLTLLAPTALSGETHALASKFDNVRVEIVDDVSTALTRTVTEYCKAGIEHSFVLAGELYTEIDFLDFFYFHREGKQKIARGFDHTGPLDMWIVDCELELESDLDDLLTGKQAHGASYFVAGYVRSLTHPREVRYLISDALHRVCALRPSGEEVRPGIWIEEDAEVDKRARIVAPAYIGRRSKVMEDALVTRFSSIEKDCYIDSGTIIEESSVLANTRIGIWLDLSHSVAIGNKIFSLGHDIALEIPDAGVMRFNGSVPKSVPNQRREDHAVKGLEERPSVPERWQLGPNLIQG
jgi:hypothetical protein